MLNGHSTFGNQHLLAMIKIVIDRYQDEMGRVLNVSFTSDTQRTYSAFVRPRSSSLNDICFDSELLHDIGLIIQALACRGQFLKKFKLDEKPLPTAEFHGDMLNATESDVVDCKTIVAECLKSGVTNLISQNVAMGHLYCHLSSDLLALNATCWRVAKVAGVSAVLFLLQHEISHLVSSHASYKSISARSTESLTLSESETFLNEESRLLELMADANSFSSMFTLIAPHAGLFYKKGRDYLISDSVYLTGVAFGLGVATYLLLLDQVSEQDELHPPESERMFWMSKWAVASCPNDTSEEDEGKRLGS